MIYLDTKMTKGSDSRVWEMLLFSLAILETVIAGFVAWTFTSVQDVRERVVRLETKVDMVTERGASSVAMLPDDERFKSIQ